MNSGYISSPRRTVLGGESNNDYFAYSPSSEEDATNLKYTKTQHAVRNKATSRGLSTLPVITYDRKKKRRQQKQTYKTKQNSEMTQWHSDPGENEHSIDRHHATLFKRSHGSAHLHDSSRVLEIHKGTGLLGKKNAVGKYWNFNLSPISWTAVGSFLLTALKIFALLILGIIACVVVVALLLPTSTSPANASELAGISSGTDLQTTESEHALAPHSDGTHHEPRQILNALSQRLDALEEIIHAAIEVQGNPGPGKPDYAHTLAGGRVILSHTSPTYKLPQTWHSWIMGHYNVGRPPVTAIHHDINVGNCWSFSGEKGQLGIHLSRKVVISGFSVDHTPKKLAHDQSSAPRQMEVWGLVQDAVNTRKARDLGGVATRELKDMPGYSLAIKLGDFSYDIDSLNNVQTFSVPEDLQAHGIECSGVLLFVNSNWGNKDLTCLYRVRVHGLDNDIKHPVERK